MTAVITETWLWCQRVVVCINYYVNYYYNKPFGSVAFFEFLCHFCLWRQSIDSSSNVELAYDFFRRIRILNRFSMDLLIIDKFCTLAICSLRCLQVTASDSYKNVCHICLRGKNMPELKSSAKILFHFMPLFV